MLLLCVSVKHAQHNALFGFNLANWGYIREVDQHDHVVVGRISSHQKRYPKRFVQDKYHLISQGIRRLQIFPPQIWLLEGDR